MGLKFIFIIQGVIRSFSETDTEVTKFVDLTILKVIVEEINSLAEERNTNFTTILIL